MDPDPPSSTQRKMKFRPKAPPRRPPAPVAASAETADRDDRDEEETQRSLTRKVKEHLARRAPRTDKKPSVQVAFMHGAESTPIRSFGKQRGGNGDTSDASKSKEPTVGVKRSLAVPKSMDVTEGVEEDSDSSADGTEYQEPWDYDSYYPTTLPWRKPYSGDPEVLDKEEFENPPEYDENTVHIADEIGLLNEDDKPHMLFFKLPEILPMGTLPTSTSSNRQERSPTSKGKEIVGSLPRSSAIPANSQGKKESGSSTSRRPMKEVCRLDELPEGYMGKMLVYKNGDIKLKLGDIMFDVSPGVPRTFAQSVVAINTDNGYFCEVGELDNYAVITPDI